MTQLRPMTATVDCGTCTACCHQVVFLMPSDDASLYEVEKIDAPNPISGAPVTLMLPFFDGHCGYLIDGKCSIYEKRPEVCRAFDCAGWVRLTMSRTTRTERRREMGKTIDPEMWKAGRERLST